MKKLWIRLAIFMAAMLGIAWANYAVLLHFHPLEYYYTPAGMLINAIVTCVESALLWPISHTVLTNWVLPAISEGLEEETKKIVNEESIITEFKDD